MPTKFRIHPGIGIARLGNSPDEFCISPERPAALPIDCGEDGNPLLSEDGKTEVTVGRFKDGAGRIKRQAARFQVYLYDEDSPEGRPIRLGDPVSGGEKPELLVDIQWQAHLANKKASWYRFEPLQGEHGYAATHPRRNADVEGGEARRRLIIDPGPRIVDCTKSRQASFDRDGGGYPASFPPPLRPSSIDTLGELKTDGSGRLLVLGGFGNSGSSKLDSRDRPRIEDYANNDGWFDDTSDGPVTARLVVASPGEEATRFVEVEAPAWVIVGYPRYVPEVLDMVTMDEVVLDLAIRHFACRTDLYGVAGTFADPPAIDPGDREAISSWQAGEPGWNPDYRPFFYRDIWPILSRPDQYSYLANILGLAEFPHDRSPHGNFDPRKLSVPPKAGSGADPHRAARRYLFEMLRQPGEENVFRSRGNGVPLMPFLCGDNPLSHTLPSKFLRLTSYQHFLLWQWSLGLFFDEEQEGWSRPDPENPYAGWKGRGGRDLDRGVLANLLGGAFCPGGESGWILRNPKVYLEPFRIKADPAFSSFRQTGSYPALGQADDFDQGLQPGDLTKHMAVPWQADFNECTTDSIKATYAEWNEIGGESPPEEEEKWKTLWWPAHRPLQVYEQQVKDGKKSYRQVDWSSGIPQNNAGNLKMVEQWWQLAFVVRTPGAANEPGEEPSTDPPPYVATERSRGRKR